MIFSEEKYQIIHKIPQLFYKRNFKAVIFNIIIPVTNDAMLRSSKRMNC